MQATDSNKTSKKDKSKADLELISQFKEAFSNLKRNKLIFVSWIIFVFILGQIILFFDIVDGLLGNFNMIGATIIKNLKSGSMYSFAIACLGSNLLSVNLEFMKEDMQHKKFKIYMNIACFISIVLMIMGWFSLSRYKGDITYRHIFFQILMYIISTVSTACLLGIQIGEENYKDYQDRAVDETINKAEEIDRIETEDGEIDI